jgi:hypothetical protein
MVMNNIVAYPEDGIVARRRFACKRDALVVCLSTLAAALESLPEKVPLAGQIAERYRVVASSLRAFGIDGLGADELAEAAAQLATIADMTTYTAERLTAALTVAAQIENSQPTLR